MYATHKIRHSKGNGRLKRKSERISLNILCVLFIIYAVTLAFPFLWLIYNSCKGKIEFFLDPWAVPQNFFGYLGNYAVIFTKFNMGAMFYNSLFLSAAIPTISVFCHACVAYAYAQHEFRLKKLLYVVAILPMIVTVTGTLPAQYRLINDMGLYDNMYLYVLTAANGFGFDFLILASVFQNMSKTYREAAEIDGAGKWRVFLQIYLPQASAVLTAMWILGFIGVWNDYMTPYLFLPSYQTLSTGIYYLRSQISVGNSEFSNDYPKLFAAMIISILPVIIIFVAFQEKIMSFSLGGGIKE